MFFGARPATSLKPSALRIPADAAFFFSVRLPFNRAHRFLAFRSLTDGPLELHLSVTTDRVTDQIFCDHDRDRNFDCLIRCLKLSISTSCYNLKRGRLMSTFAAHRFV